MIARAQQPSLVFRVVWVKASTLADVKGVRKDRAELRERCFIARALARRHLEIRILHARLVLLGHRVERVQVFAVLSAADEPAFRLRHFHFDRRRLIGRAKRRALEIAPVRRVLPVLPIHERLRRDAQALHDGAGELQCRVLTHPQHEVAHLYELIEERV